MEHLRQHERVTNADVASQKNLERFLVQPPAVSHLITAEKIESVNVTKGP
jgi:hypothetical protein